MEDQFKGLGQDFTIWIQPSESFEEWRFGQRSSGNRRIILEILCDLILLRSREEKNLGSTSNIGFVGLHCYISLVNYICKVRLISLSQFEFELRADVR